MSATARDPTAPATVRVDAPANSSGSTVAGRQRRDVAQQRRAHARCLEGLARMPRHLHATVVVASILLTLLGAWYSHERVARRADASFERETARVSSALLRRLSRYEDALQAGIAVLDASGGRVDSATWSRFATGLELDHRYPGVNGIGLIERVEPGELERFLVHERVERPAFDVHPLATTSPADRPLYPIVQIEPLAENRPALGLDIGFEARRRAAADAALADDEPRITGPIQLVQDARSRAGFLFYLPYHGTRRASAGNDAMTGLVYAPFIVEDLVHGALPAERRRVEIALSDGPDMLFDGRGDASLDAVHTASTQLSVYGREWRVDYRATPAFERATASLQPWLVLASGVVIDLMLIGLFISFARVDRALRVAATLSAELDHRSRTLERSNRELERFACVASHDLKTPLRGIGDLAWYLREDLAPYIGGDDANPDVTRHLERLERQTARMEALIDGIQEYSGIGRHAEARVELSLARVASELEETLGLTDGRLVIAGPLPDVMTEAVQLNRVITNLVSNAFKYHHDAANATVTFAASVESDELVFSIRDDGPGIDPRFHDRVFEMFETLQPKDRIESTGIGLAIVKKLVEERGGAIALDSASGAGSTFTVRWPLTPVDTGVADIPPRARAA